MAPEREPTTRVGSVTVDDRFCGPPRSGNGGYVCGLVAAALPGGPVSVRLKAPPPIGKPLRLEVEDGAARLLDGETLIAEGARAPLALEVPPAPSLAEAVDAAKRYLGFEDHNFPGCFVCGPAREAGDGLRIFPGALARDPAVLAAPWTPDATLADGAGVVRAAFVWAALDCPGAFTRYPLPDGIALVLGELAVAAHAPLAVGTPCVVVAWSLGEEGRRRFAGTALYTASGALVAAARAVWVAVPARIWR